MCSSLLLAGMICHFYREGFCSNRSVMLRRLMPRVERLCSMALVAGGRMPSAPRRMSAELKLSHPTKSSLRCVGGIFLFRGRLHLENFRSRLNVILCHNLTLSVSEPDNAAAKQGQELRSGQTATPLHEQNHLYLFFAS